MQGLPEHYIDHAAPGLWRSSCAHVSLGLLFPAHMLWRMNLAKPDQTDIDRISGRRDNSVCDQKQWGAVGQSSSVQAQQADCHCLCVQCPERVI